MIFSWKLPSVLLRFNLLVFELISFVLSKPMFDFKSIKCYSSQNLTNKRVLKTNSTF